MEERQELEQPENTFSPIRHYEPRVRLVLLAQFGLFIVGAGLGGLVFQVLCLATSWDPSLSLVPDSPPDERWQVRTQLGLGHLFAFLASGWLTAWLFYRRITDVGPSWPDYLRIRKLPDWRIGGLAILLMAVSIPLVLFSLNINQWIPMPESFKLMEDQTDQILKGLLQMEHVGEFLANLTIIAVLPAIGEELVFRGVVQQQLMRRINNPWVAILVSAFIFSMAHFQFEGFLPRMLLGIILGWLYWQSRNFWVPVLAHFFNNGIQVAGQYLYGNKISSIDLEQDIAVPWPLALASAVMVWMVMRAIRNLTQDLE